MPFETHRKIPAGPLAISPRSLAMFLEDWGTPQNETASGAVIVHVHGPLGMHASVSCDSYEAIKRRVQEALASSEPTVIIELDTPGGVITGLFAFCRDLRAIVAASTKRVIAYVNQANSAGYAIAAACPEIWAAPESLIGSIGILNRIRDERAAETVSGVVTSLVVSGFRKADGDSHQQLLGESHAHAQQLVNQLAEAFFVFVAESRGISPDVLRSLEGREMLALEAASFGLVDQLGTFDQCLLASRQARLLPGSAGLPAVAAATTAEERTMDPAKLLEALRAMAEGEDANAQWAKKALALLEQKDEVPKEPQEAAASPAPDAPPDEEEEACSNRRALGAVVSHPAFKALQAQVAQMAANEAKRAEQSERSALLASRPDFSEQTRKELAAASLDTVRYAVKSFPIVSGSRDVMAALAGVGSHAAPQGCTSVGLSEAENEQMRLKMGLIETKPVCSRKGHTTTLGALVPVKETA